MKKIPAVILSAILLCALLLSSASAGTVTMNGTVVSIRTETVKAALGGTVSQVHVSAGDHVLAGETLVTLGTEKVYALEDGTMRFFGAVGDSAEALTARYGAVAYVEPDCQYTVSASTKNAYDLEENKVIHPGETVYLKSVNDSKNTATGVVTSVSGSSYQIEVLSGSVRSGESMYVHRTADFSSTSRIGRGSVSHKDPVVYDGAGVIVSYRVENGGHVKKGDVLFETLSGAYANQTGDLCAITAERDGVVAAIELSKGASLAAGDTVAEFYADGDLRIEATVSEADLQYFQVGDAVVATFMYLDDGEYAVDGVIEKIARISAAADEETNEASYAVLIKPASTERLYYGMNAVIERK